MVPIESETEKVRHCTEYILPDRLQTPSTLKQYEQRVLNSDGWSAVIACTHRRTARVYCRGHHRLHGVRTMHSTADMRKDIPSSSDRRRDSLPSTLWQAAWVLLAGGILGILTSVMYYRLFGAPEAWRQMDSTRIGGGIGEWWVGNQIADGRMSASGDGKGAFGGRRSLQSAELARLRQGVPVETGGVVAKSPIFGRSDDWPLQWPGDDRPYYDFLLVVFSGDDLDAFAKRENMREIYDTYGEEILITDELGQAFLYTFKVLYVVGHPAAVDAGDLMDDVLYVKVQKGYRNIAAKTKKMLEAVNHIRFKYLLKADDDTFVCLRRTASQIHLVPPHIKPKVYGGIPTACHLPNNPKGDVGKVIKDKHDKWYDGKYLNHTMNGLDCYPVYMQGAFYILSYPLVEFLNQGSPRLLTFDNEDVTIGLWLHGVNRAIFPLNDLRDARLWECSCKRDNFVPGNDANVFFHDCKTIEDLKACKVSLPMC